MSDKDRTTLETCEICQHCWPVFDDGGLESAGECRRFPPVTQQLPRQGGGMTLIPLFPRMRKGVGCGEFKLRERVGS